MAENSDNPNLAGPDTMRFRIVQEGLAVAGAEGPADAAMRDIGHYYDLYSQDGPCVIEWYTKGRRWKETDIGELESAMAFRAQRQAA